MEKNNIISEKELNKIINLIESKHAALISEQAMDISSDVGRLKRQFDYPNTNETDVVNIIKKYKTKKDFQNLVSQYEKIMGMKLGGQLRVAITPSTDATEWNDLKSHLATIGITLSQTSNVGDDSTLFKGLNTPAVNSPATTDRQKNINITFCSVKNGVIINKSSTFNNTSWENWKKTYKPTDAELQVAQKSCPRKRKTGQSGQSGQSVNDRFTKSVSSLGVENGKMDVATLQKILATLEGGTTQPKNASDFAPQGVPQDAFNQQSPPTDNELA